MLTLCFSMMSHATLILFDHAFRVCIWLPPSVSFKHLSDDLMHGGSFPFLKHLLQKWANILGGRLSFSIIILGIDCPYSLRRTVCLITNLDLKIHFPSSLTLPPSGAFRPLLHTDTRTDDQWPKVFFSSYCHGGVPWKSFISHRCRNLKIRGTVFIVSIVNCHIGESSKIISVFRSS